VEATVQLSTLVDLVENRYDKANPSFTKMKEGLSQFQLCYLIYKGAQSLTYGVKYRAKHSEDVRSALQLQRTLREGKTEAAKEAARQLGMMSTS
jgi:hypothetical protein